MTALDERHWTIVIIVNIIIDCLLCSAIHEALCKTQELQPLQESGTGIVIKHKSMVNPDRSNKY